MDEWSDDDALELFLRTHGRTPEEIKRLKETHGRKKPAGKNPKKQPALKEK